MLIETTKAVWFSPDTPPEKMGWYQCLNLDGSPAHRLWEEGVWWLHTYIEPDEFGEDGGWELVPNNSISYWALIEPPTIARVCTEGTA